MDARTLDKRSRMAFPLTGFRDFLAARECSYSTVGVYLAYVRCALRAAKAGQLPDQETVIKAMLSLPITRRGGFTSAWKKYVEYAHGQGIELPPVDHRDSDGLRVIRTNLPKFVELTHFKPRELYDLKMRQLQPTKDGIRFNPTSVQGRVRFLSAEPKANLEPFYAIMGWAYPTEKFDPDAPFLPEAPGADLPVPLKTIRNILTVARRDEPPMRIMQTAELAALIDEKEREKEASLSAEPLFGKTDAQPSPGSSDEGGSSTNG